MASLSIYEITYYLSTLSKWVRPLIILSFNHLKPTKGLDALSGARPQQWRADLGFSSHGHGGARPRPWKIRGAGHEEETKRAAGKEEKRTTKEEETSATGEERRASSGLGVSRGFGKEVTQHGGLHVRASGKKARSGAAGQSPRQG